MLDNGISGENHQLDEHSVVWITPSRRWGDRDGVTAQNEFGICTHMGTLQKREFRD